MARLKSAGAPRGLGRLCGDEEPWLAVHVQPKKPGVRRLLWLHTQPEHYFNIMLDDLTRQSPGDLEYVAAFAWRGPGWYQDHQPALAPSLLLTPAKGPDAPRPRTGQRYHRDWRGELFALQFDAAIVSGYAHRTERELILECHRRGIPVAMFSDSNLRSQRGRGLRTRARRWAKRRFLRPYIRSVDWLLTANRRGVAYWRYYGAPASKIVVCPYYADYHRAAAARQTPADAARARIGLAPAARYFFTAARLVHDKGIDLMLQAFRNARLVDRGWHYVVAGVGPQEAPLKYLASTLRGHVHFVGFQQPADNLAMMAHAEALVLPSRYEPHGIVIQEATSMGVPVLASDVCGAAADLVLPGVSGALFRSGDVADLTARLTAFATDDARLHEMRAGARHVFETWFDRTNPVKVVDRIARKMLAGEHA